MPDIRCPNCGRRNAEGARYCAGCGVNLGDAAPKDAHGRPQYEAVRKWSFGEWIRRVFRRTS